jgi:hypothetical protein
MSNNQPLTHVDRSEVFKELLKQDINALRGFMYKDANDVIDTIKYWKVRRQEPDVVKNKDQRDTISLEIIRLEALLLGKTEFTFSYFKIAEDNIISASAEIMSKDLFKSIEPVSGDTVVDLMKDLVDKGGKVIPMLPEKIKLVDLREKCKSLLLEGKGEEAIAFATKYLSVGNYIPDKKIKGKPDLYHKGRIESWVAEITRGLKFVNNLEPKNQPAPIVDKTPTTPVTELQDTKPGAKEVIADTVPSTKVEPEPVKTKTEDEPIVPREGSVEINMKENPEAFEIWMAASGRTLEDWFGPELMEDDKYKEFDSIQISTEDVDNLVKELIEIYGLKASEVVDEEADEKADEDNVSFENDDLSLDEEITHIEDFLVKLHKLRGTDSKKPENLDEIKELCNTFFESREDEDYEEQDKVFEIIRDHPENLKDAKAFFNLISYPKPILLTAKDGKGVITTDNYNSVILEIESDLKEAESKKGNEVDKAVAKLEDKWVNHLRGHILASKEQRADKTFYIANKVTFYTQYHVYDFIDKIANAEITSKSTATAQSAATVPSTEIKVDVVIPRPDKAPAPKTEDKPVEKTHVCTTIEEALALVVKNGGKEADAQTHPFCEALKGTTISAGPFKMTLDEVNYKNYINSKYDEALALYKSTLTTYPMEDMATLISQAVSTKQTPEDFVKENLSLIQKEDGTFLKVTGKLGDADYSANITSEETFLSWVKEMYELEEKIGINDEPEKVYEVSTTIKSYVDFEKQIKDKATKVALPELQKWAREVACDKVFGEDNHKTPFWFSAEDKVDYLNNYIEALTRAHYTTPESKAKKETELSNYIISKLKGSTDSLFNFVNELRKYCTEKNLDYNLKSLKAIVLSLAETHNKTMLDNYLKLSGETKDKEPVSKKGDEKPIVNETIAPIVEEKIDDIKDTNTIVSKIFAEAKDVKDKLAFSKVIWKYRGNSAAVLRAAIHLIIGDKRIVDLKLTTVGEVNTWVSEIISKTSLETAPVDVKDKSTIPSTAVEEDLFIIFGNSEKKTFRDNLDRLIEANEDSTEFRGKLIDAMKASKASHVMTVAKQSMEEMHKMIKSAFERKEDKQLK